MTDLLVLDLVKKGIGTDQMVLNLGFEIENVIDTEKMKNFKGEVTFDHYGRAVPKGVHGSVNLPEYTSSTKTIMEYMLKLYDQIAERNLTVRRLNVVANHVISEKGAEELRKEADAYCQMDLFTDYDKAEKEKEARKEQRQREKICRRLSLR